ncbi:hypothetical protein BC940DRAFT_306513 [Gongronella butleri]|nr:hypothetical protein BC940DRAFT_306513 [Gongronella butleri]
MAQYLIAQWDYEAEGEFELSFHQGDRIKLLEKHNDDWWEGELNDTIGFFPANRTLLEPRSTSSAPPSPERAKAIIDASPLNEEPSNDNGQASAPAVVLLPGWAHAFDDQGTIYYFNEQSGESSWEAPTQPEKDKETTAASQSHPSLTPKAISTANATHTPVTPADDLDFDFALDPQAMKKLSLDRLEKDARQQGFVQMKMVSHDSGKLSSWKVYYGVLVHGYFLLYKEAHVKNRKKMTTLPPVGSFDLGLCQIQPAGKQDTKRKHCFLVSLPPPKKITLYVQPANENDYAAWTDAIMRDLIVRKEQQQQQQQNQPLQEPPSEIVQLLHALTLDDQRMKVNQKLAKPTDPPTSQQQQQHQHHHPPNKKMPSWFNKANSKANHDTHAPSNLVRSPPPMQQHAPGNDNDVFGGLLPTNGFPIVIQQCIDQVEARGLDVVGIYRLSGPASAIQKYRAAYNRREPVHLEQEHDVNVCTGLLKLYLRELKDPLLTFEYYDWFMEAARIDDYDERMYQIKSVIHALPKPNLAVLEALMRHLQRVADRCDVNKMETSNLALIFSVGLLRRPGHDMSGIIHADLQNKVVEAIIQQVDWFFELDDDDAAKGSTA